MGKNLITDLFPAQLLMCHIGFDKGEETLDLVGLENDKFRVKNEIYTNELRTSRLASTSPAADLCSVQVMHILS